MNRMDPWKTSLMTLVLGLTISMVTPQSDNAGGRNNAQATSVGSGSGSSAGDSDTESAKIVRRYVPQFIGKRENEQTALGIASSSENSKESDVDAIDNDVDFVNLLKQYENYDSEYDASYEDDSGEAGYGSFDGYGDLDGYPEYDDKPDGSGINELDNEEHYDEDSGSAEKDKRYTPMFVGKRYQPMFVGKRYQPMFVGKRYQPMFVGKRYKPMFVGKRYQPTFVGKRYQPTFVGKRYQPTFVGKRYQPTFVGKRYQPTFVGKRYQPTFVGKRYTPMFVGKRYQPTFVGKRYTPQFVGKRYTPLFVGKRYTPMFVGKRYTPMFVGKRSTSAEEQTDSTESLLDLSAEHSLEKRSTETTEDIKSRHKRSLGFDNEFKRAWGRYVPWQDIPTIKVLRSEPPVDKRFVTPEFIGRRDSISSILSALKALKFARSAPRLEAKRFQAPLFVGKRGSNPSDLVLRYDMGSPDTDRWEDLSLYQ